MLPRDRLLTRLLVAAGASLGVFAACSSVTPLDGGAAAGSSGTGGAAGGLCLPSDDTDNGCLTPGQSPPGNGCCQVRCYAPVASPVFRPDTCFRDGDGGEVVLLDGGVADAAAGVCLPTSEPELAGLLGAQCQGGLTPLRGGELSTDDAGAPTCCYGALVGWTGRPLPIAGTNRVAPLRRTAAWT